MVTGGQVLPNPSPALRQLMGRFGEQPGVTPEMAANLRTTIEGSPLLIERMNLAAEQGHLKGFRPLASDTSASATYDSETHTIQLPLAKLKPLDERGNKFDIADMTFVLGHEVQHGFNRAQRQQAMQAAASEMRAIAKSPDPRNDMTGPAERMQQAGRGDEAKAHIAGWNALLSRVKAAHPEADLKTMWIANDGRARDFIDKTGSTYQPKSGLTFNPDNSLSPTPDNVATMGRYYYDKEKAGIGVAKSTYPNYNGVTVVHEAVQHQRQYAKPYQGHEPQLLLDMQRLQMQEEKLEINGLDLGRSAERQPRQPYYDISDGTMRPGYFDHTRSGPNANRHVPVAPTQMRWLQPNRRVRR